MCSQLTAWAPQKHFLSDGAECLKYVLCLGEGKGSHAGGSREETRSQDVTPCSRKGPGSLEGMRRGGFACSLFQKKSPSLGEMS